MESTLNNKDKVKMMKTSTSLLQFINNLISVSDFSKGKTSKIMDDVSENNSEYIVLKNNQPKAVLISVDKYSEMAKKAEKLEAVLEKIEEQRLLSMAEEEMKNMKHKKWISQEDMMEARGITMAELEDVQVEIE